MKPTRTVKTDTIEVWKAQIIEQEHIKELLEDIKAELTKDYVDDNPDNFRYTTVMLKDVLAIIDKHIGKAESEE